MVKFVFNGGHGFNTAGKRSPDGEREWSFNNVIVLAAMAEMQKYKNAELLRTDDPTGKTDIPLETRMNKAIKWGAKYYISIHNNAYQSRWGSHGGTETLVQSLCTQATRNLAAQVQAAQVGVLGLRNRGVKNSDVLYELNAGKRNGIHTIITESAFMDSTTDITSLRDKSKLQGVGKAIAQAVAKHAGLQLKEVKPVAPQKPKDDVKGHWAEASINKAIKADVMTRNADGQFRPNEPVTRAQLAAILDRLKLI